LSQFSYSLPHYNKAQPHSSYLLPSHPLLSINNTMRLDSELEVSLDPPLLLKTFLISSQEAKKELSQVLPTSPEPSSSLFPTLTAPTQDQIKSSSALPTAPILLLLPANQQQSISSSFKSPLILGSIVQEMLLIFNWPVKMELNPLLGTIRLSLPD